MSRNSVAPSESPDVELTPAQKAARTRAANKAAQLAAESE